MIYNPDGGVHAERKKLPLWKEQVPPATNIQLSKAILGMRFGKDEPAGEYKVVAKVTDFECKYFIELERNFVCRKNDSCKRRHTNHGRERYSVPLIKVVRFAAASSQPFDGLLRSAAV
jgi:hypothetical protein